MAQRKFDDNKSDWAEEHPENASPNPIGEDSAGRQVISFFCKPTVPPPPF